MSTKVPTTKAPVSKFEHNARTAARDRKAPRRLYFEFETTRPYYRRWRQLETTRAMYTPYGFCKNKAAKLGKAKPSDLYISADGLFVYNAKACDQTTDTWRRDFVPFSGSAQARFTAWLEDNELPACELSISAGKLERVTFLDGFFAGESVEPGKDLPLEFILEQLGILKPKALVA